jgi:hypothetical protein
MQKCENKINATETYQRFYMKLGKTSIEEMGTHLESIHLFVEKHMNNDKTEILNLKVASYAQRKQLAREVWNR